MIQSGPYGSEATRTAVGIRRRRMLLCFLFYWLPLFFNGFYDPVLVSTPPLFWTGQIVSHLLRGALLVYLVRSRTVGSRRLGFTSHIGGRPRPVLLVPLAVVFACVLWAALRGAGRIAPLWVANPYEMATFSFSRPFQRRRSSARWRPPTFFFRRESLKRYSFAGCSCARSGCACPTTWCPWARSYASIGSKAPVPCPLSWPSRSWRRLFSGALATCGP